MKIIKLFGPFFTNYVLNYFVSVFPIWLLRRAYMRLLNVKIGERTIIDMRFYIIKPKSLIVGKFSHINRGCFLDARGGLIIGNNVSISHNVSLVSASHDMNSRFFDYISAPIVINDNVWIGLNAIILKGVTIGEGAVVAAGSVVSKDVDAFTVVAGIPAKKIADREKELQYNCTDFAYFKSIRKPYFF